MRAAIVKQYINEPRDIILVNAIQALNELGYSIDLVSNQKSDLSKLGINVRPELRVASYNYFLPFSFRDILIYERMTTSFASRRVNPDIALDVHGDLPAYQLGNSAQLIIYCLFPLPALLYRGHPAKYRQSLLSRIYAWPYRNLARRSAKLDRGRVTMVAQSQFCKRAIKWAYGMDSPVIYPPVEVEKYKGGLGSQIREDRILVVSRISPEKELETAIGVLRELRKSGSDFQMTIVGALSPWKRAYLQKLRDYARGLPIKFAVDASSNQLLQEMMRSKLYLHTMPGEHFGLATVESMSAGLIPIVPVTGGHTEFVPKEYHYRTAVQAAELITRFKDVPFSARKLIHEVALGFSQERFRRELKSLVENVRQRP